MILYLKKSYKYFFIIYGIILSFPVFGQSNFSIDSCYLIIKNIVNEDSLVIHKASREEIRLNDLGGKGLFQIVLLKTQNEYSFVIKSLKNICFEHNSKVQFIFRDGSKVESFSSNKDNCESTLIVSFDDGISNANIISRFNLNNIIGIQFNSSDQVSYRLKVETIHSELLQDIIECMSSDKN